MKNIRDDLVKEASHEHFTKIMLHTESSFHSNFSIIPLVPETIKKGFDAIVLLSQLVKTMLNLAEVDRHYNPPSHDEGVRAASESRRRRDW